MNVCPTHHCYMDSVSNQLINCPYEAGAGGKKLPVMPSITVYVHCKSSKNLHRQFII